jgi:D-alanyl-D-alanine carboxypeptidase
MHRWRNQRQRSRSIVAAVGLALAASACVTAEVESGTDPAVVEVTSSLAAPPSTTTAPSTTMTTAAPSVSSAASTTAAPTPVAPVVPLSGWAALDQYLEVTLVRGGSAAASVAVLRNGELQHVAAYGRRVAGEAAEPADRFRVASISKTILAITALELVEDGVLTLDEPVGSLLATRLDVSSPAAGAGAITLRDLLTHRSGFPQYENLFFRNEVASCPDAARAGFTRPLQSAAGTSFQYSNMNFCVLGLLIEQVTGAPYAQVVQEQVLTPLAITSMRTAGTFDIESGDVEHESDEGRNYMEVLGGAGAWLAAPADLVTILNSLDLATPGTKVLESATLEMMAAITVTPPSADDDAAAADQQPAPTTTIEPAPPTQGYGMGLLIFDAPLAGGTAAATFGHTGTLESTHAMFVRRPDGITWAITISGDYPASTREIATIMDNALLLGGFTDGTYTTPPPPLDEA